MSFIDIDRNFSLIHVAKTSWVIEVEWRQIEGRILFGASHDSADYFAKRFTALWMPTVKVGFIRNAWAMWVSFYHHYGFDKGEHAWMQAGKNGRYYETFRDFLLHREEWLPFLPTSRQWPMLCNSNGNIIVDRVCRTENLQAEFDWICKTTGFPRKELPSKPHRDYAAYYDGELHQIVSDISCMDIDIFKMTFKECA